MIKVVVYYYGISVCYLLMYLLVKYMKKPCLNCWTNRKSFCPERYWNMKLTVEFLNFKIWIETGKNRRTCPPNSETQKKFDAVEVVPFPPKTHVIIDMDMEDDDFEETVEKGNRFWKFIQTRLTNLLSSSRLKYSSKVSV